MKNSDKMLSSEKMLPLILKMALPSVMAQLVNLLYGIVDRIYIGHIAEVGKDALAGVGITSSIIMLISAFSSLAGAGGAPLCSMALGKSDKNEAERILNTGFVMLLCFAVFCTTVPYIIMDKALTLCGASDVTLPYAKEYLSTYLIGTLFVMISSGMNMYLSAEGRPGAAMCSVLIGALLNTALDPLFIFVFKLGVKGAAVATVISQLASACWVMVCLTDRNAALRLNLRALRPSLRHASKIAALGIAPFVMAATESIIGFTLNGQLSLYGGDLHVSALAIMQSAMQIISIPLSGFAQGVVPIISYNFGHGDNLRVKKCFFISLAIMFSFNFIGFALMIVFSGTVASAFTNDALLIQTVKEHMPLFLLGMTIFGLQRTCQNTFVALGQAKTSLFIALLRKIILLVPLCFILPRFLGVRGVYAAEALADFTAATLCSLIFFIRFPQILKKNDLQNSL